MSQKELDRDLVAVIRQITEHYVTLQEASAGTFHPPPLAPDLPSPSPQLFEPTNVQIYLSAPHPAQPRAESPQPYGFSMTAVYELAGELCPPSRLSMGGLQPLGIEDPGLARTVNSRPAHGRIPSLP